MIEVPTATSPPPTETFTPAPPTSTAPPTPIDCSLYTMSDFNLGSGNRPEVMVNNGNPASDVRVVEFRLDWLSAFDWADALGYNNINVDWFEWGGDIFFGDEGVRDYTTPTILIDQNQLLPAGTSVQWLIDMDFDGEIINRHNFY